MATQIVVGATRVIRSGALVFRSGLVLIDNWLQRVGAPFKYYSSLAKLMHIWRDNARQVFLSWLARFGAVEAVRHAKRMPPRCIAGRRGSISVVENLLLDAGQDQVQSVFLLFLDIASAPPPGQPGVLHWRMVHRLQPWRTRLQGIQSLRSNKWQPCRTIRMTSQLKRLQPIDSAWVDGRQKLE